MSFKVVIISLLLSILVLSCSDQHDYYYENDQMFWFQGVVYKSIGDLPLKLDIYCPKKGEDNYPVILFIHGGGWSYGNRTNYQYECIEAAKRGYIAITMDYRLTIPRYDQKIGYRYPAQIEDVISVMKWIRSRAKKYKMDISKVGVIGYSAGAHLAQLIGCMEADGYTQPKAIFSIAGISDMLSFYSVRYKKRDTEVIDKLFGGKPNELYEKYLHSSPIHHVTGDDPPIYILHGLLDEVVPVDQATAMIDRINETGGTVTHNIVENYNHGVDLTINYENDDPVWIFFDSYLKE